MLMDNYVLVVDDNPDVQKLMLDILEAFDVEGRKAFNGQQALDMVWEAPPTVIVLDLMMPVMDGFTMLTHLQGNQASRQIPVILLSALVDSSNNRHMQKFPGVIGVMAKGNFSIEAFRALLSQAGVVM